MTLHDFELMMSRGLPGSYGCVDATLPDGRTRFTATIRLRPAMREHTITLTHLENGSWSADVDPHPGPLERTATSHRSPGNALQVLRSRLEPYLLPLGTDLPA